MFLDTVILVLQEILEAALVISVMLALTRQLNRYWGGVFNLGYSWLLPTFILGFIGAWIYAAFTPVISQWFDYVGLEIANALIQVMIISFLLCLCYTLTQKRIQQYHWLNLLAGVCITFVVALGIIREVSEIIIYLNGILAQPENFTSVFLGSLVALGIGASSGIILFYLLNNLPGLWSQRICMLLLALYSGNMASQASLLLIQADWLPYTQELWDTSFLLPEYTVPGQLLYALIGYEANPSILQAASYVCAALLVLISPLFRVSWRHASQPNLIQN